MSASYSGSWNLANTSLATHTQTHIFGRALARKESTYRTNPFLRRSFILLDISQEDPETIIPASGNYHETSTWSIRQRTLVGSRMSGAKIEWF
ncbi:hypothetical protein RSAG8_05594, partial [Rhizoctonia solani AG-8 WAC10335]